MSIVETIRTRELLRSGEARKIRERANISRAELAKDVPVDQTTLRNWEIGRTIPRGEKATRYGGLLRMLAEHSGE